MNRIINNKELGEFIVKVVKTISEIGSIKEVLSEEFKVVEGIKTCEIKLSCTICKREIVIEFSYLIEKHTDYKHFQTGFEIGLEYKLLSIEHKKKLFLIVTTHLLLKTSKSSRLFNRIFLPEETALAPVES